MKIEFLLKEGEEILHTAKISKAAIAAIWISIPLAVLIFYFPALLGLIRGTLWGNVLFGEGFSTVLGVLLIILVVVLSPLIFAYVIFAIVYSRRNRAYALVVTNYRVIGKTSKQELAIRYEEIVNVHLGRSILGKLCSYGDLTLQGERGNITVKNIKDAEEIRRMILEKADIN